MADAMHMPTVREALRMLGPDPESMRSLPRLRVGGSPRPLPPEMDATPMTPCPPDDGYDEMAAEVMAAEAPTRTEEKAAEIRMDLADEERQAAEDERCPFGCVHDAAEDEDECSWSSCGCQQCWEEAEYEIF